MKTACLNNPVAQKLLTYDDFEECQSTDHESAVDISAIPTFVLNLPHRTYRYYKMEQHFERTTLSLTLFEGLFGNTLYNKEDKPMNMPRHSTLAERTTTPGEYGLIMTMRKLFQHGSFNKRFGGTVRRDKIPCR